MAGLSGEIGAMAEPLLQARELVKRFGAAIGEGAIAAMADPTICTWKMPWAVSKRAIAP